VAQAYLSDSYGVSWHCRCINKSSRVACFIPQIEYESTILTLPAVNTTQCNTHYCSVEILVALSFNFQALNNYIINSYQAECPRIKARVEQPRAQTMPQDDISYMYTRCIGSSLQTKDYDKSTGYTTSKLDHDICQSLGMKCHAAQPFESREKLQNAKGVLIDIAKEYFKDRRTRNDMPLPQEAMLRWITPDGVIDERGDENPHTIRTVGRKLHLPPWQTQS
jgi:hypothetical protein